MVTRETNFGVFASAMLAIVVLPLVACGDSTRAGGARGDGSGGSGGSSGSTGGSSGGSNGVGGGAGGSAATAGSGADGTGAGGSGNAGGGGAGGAEEAASFHWIEPTDEHRERAREATTRVFLRTVVVAPFDVSVLIGTSTVIIGENFEQVATEAIVWTEAEGTTGLGGLPGGNDGGTGFLSEARAISADGSVVVGRATDSEGDTTAFRWTRAGGMEAIAGGDGAAVAVSADGSVVLGERLEPPLAFRWTQALGTVNLEPLAGDGGTDALALSADGATVLGQSSSPGGARLFVWTESTGTRAVENLPGYTTCRVGLATFGRSYGFAVGGACTNETGGYEPFVWTGQDGLVTLGPTDALDGYLPSDPVAVTDDGSVAVGRAGDAASGSRAYRWTAANGFELIELPEGYTRSAPVASRSTMSEDGSVVVGTMGGSARRAFLWSEDAGTIVLSPLDGHDISDVYVVSADGSVAAGSSFRLGAADVIEESTAVYWRADGVAHSVADELAAEGVDLGGGAIHAVEAAKTPLAFVGIGVKDQVSAPLAWWARLP